MLSGHRLGSVPGGNREMKYVREPRDSTLSWTNLFRPPMMAAMEITDDTPMIMPITVSPERTLLLRRVSIADKKYSRAWEGVIMVIIPTSWRSPDRAAKRAVPDRSRKTTRHPNSETRRT